MRKRSKPETVLQARIISAIEIAFPRAKVLRMNAGSIQRAGRRIELAPTGFPDIMVFLPGGAVVLIEVKTSAGAQSDAQLGWAAWFNQNGYHCSVIRTQQEALDFIARCT